MGTQAPEIPTFRRRRRVAVLVDFSRAYGRGLLRGIARYASRFHGWSVQCEEWRWTEPTPSWLQHWRGDGVIAWVETAELATVITGLGVPVVDVRGVTNVGLPLVDTENQAAATLAAEHYMQRGFRHYAYCGFAGANYSDTRARWFRERLARAGFECAIYSPPSPGDAHSVEYEKRGLLHQEHLARWLAALPKPVAIMACNDIRGHQVLNACHRRHLLVPEQVAVVGVDNDEVFCELSDPPLTSVALDTLRIGYEAAALLDRMMAGAAPPAEPIRIIPAGIIVRRSSDTLAMDDPRLAAGARFMRENAFHDISIDDIARAAGISRRTFERRFAERVGRSPRAEMQRLRLDRVKSLLAETDWTLERIAEQTGYKYAEYLHTVFTRTFGTTPGKFRREQKLSGARS